VTTPINRRDLPFAVFMIASFLFGVAVSWQRWGNPLVDCGREMNQPLRLANGEMLYSDVRHIYGPLSPYLNSLFYRLFGSSLNVLYGSGIVSAIVILALSYWLARQLMNRWAATAATLSVMWLCAFKQAGNYFLPYSYSALHGCALGLITLALLVLAISQRSSTGELAVSNDVAGQEINDGQALAGYVETRQAPPRVSLLLLAGIFAALTLLAKTEMGIAAIAVGLIATALFGFPSWRRSFSLISWFLLPAIAIPFVVYGVILAKVGWHTFTNESYLLLQNVPPELVYFNKRMSGFDRPMESIISILGALMRTILLVVAVSVISQLITRRRGDQGSFSRIAITESGRAKVAFLWLLLLFSIGLMIFLSFAGVMEWDSGPYLAMPILLVGLLVPETNKYLKQIAQHGFANRQTLLLIIIATYSLASLARVILRVRSGGAYSSYLLPTSVILFTYILAYQFSNLLKESRARILARNIIIGLILADAVITSGLLAYRYRSRNDYPLVTRRGTILAVQDLGKSFDQAIEFINRETVEGEPVAVLPEGTSLLFFTNRTNPLREEITTPGFLDFAGEERAIKQLTQTNTRIVLIANRATSEFGATIFGRDYCQHLMEWIKTNFEEGEVFSPDGNRNLQIGDKVFFIKAYRKKSV
jgi:4-amino-4-deoxy-L-arabinose transferase-like glycosyltransferase